jgi:hypothetical protein
MRDWDKSKLTQFYQTYPQKYPILKHEAFNEFWAEQRAALYPKNPFVAQKHIPDCDLVLGYVFYLLSIKFKTSADKSQEYLQLALKYDSIHAAQTHLHKLIMQRCDQARKVETITETLSGWNKLAAKHGAPGFLLLANGYLQLAKTLYELNDTERYNKSCFELWKNLTLVALEEPQSEASINNAFFGQGLAFGNPLKLTTVEAIKESAGRIIADNTIKERAEHTAHASFTDDACKAQLLAWRKSRQSPVATGQAVAIPELDESALINIR